MMSSATILIVVALLSMMPIVRGRQEIDAQQKTFYVHTTGTQTMMFNIPNTEQNEVHESLDDVFLGESLNSLKSLELYASTDDFSINTVAESSDVHSAADSITTRTCNESNFEDDNSFDGLDDTASEDPVVTTLLGQVRGRTLDKAHVFYGIPFADPPVGDKRWTPPSPLSPWLYIYDATFPRPACMQMCAGEFSQLCPPKVCNICNHYTF